MQVILTETEYLKLKNQHEEDKRLFVKKSDVYHAAEEMVKDFQKTITPMFEPFKSKEMEEILKRFLQRIEL